MPVLRTIIVKVTRQQALRTVIINRGPAGGGTGTGGTGEDGREILLRNNGTYVQWQYEGDLAWTNLIALADITGNDGTNGTNGTNGLDGDDGREVLLQVTATHIQWSYTGGAWTDLIALSALTGPKGDTGDAGPNAVTSATTSDGTGNLTLASLTIGGVAVVLGNDSRLTNSRTPTAHKSTHATGGSDALAPSDIGALAAAGPAMTGDLTVTSNGHTITIYTPGLLGANYTHTRPEATGTHALTGSATGVPDTLDTTADGKAVTIGTGSNVTINSTYFTFGTGAAAAFRAATKVPASDKSLTGGHASAVELTNCLGMTEAQYAGITPNSTTTYFCTAT